VLAQIHLRPCVKYGCHYTDFHKLRTISLNFCTRFPYKSSWNPQNRLVTDTMSQTSGWTDLVSILILISKYLLNVIGLAPGGSSTVHIYTETLRWTTHLTTIWEECGQCPVFASYTLAFALQMRKKHGKTSGRVAEECQLARWKRNIQGIFLLCQERLKADNVLNLSVANGSSESIPLNALSWFISH
jgi:hypothetical protein